MASIKTCAVESAESYGKPRSSAMNVYLLIPKLDIHNANAMSSSYTIGFPAMTAWLGAVHALQRRLRSNGFPKVELYRVAVSCHDCNLQTYKGPHDNKYSIIGTANPLKKKNNSFERPPFIEEPRCHLKVSLLVELKHTNPDEEQEFLDAVSASLTQMKLAGGDILAFQRPTLEYADMDDGSAAHIIRKLMPGYVVIDRSDLLGVQREPGTDALDFLLDTLAVHFSSAGKREEGQAPQWTASRKQPGWIVPLAVGFKDLSGPVKVKNQRSLDYEHHFVEAVVTVGEFKMPIHFRDSKEPYAVRLQDLDDMMWKYRIDSARGLYLCENENQWNKI